MIRLASTKTSLPAFSSQRNWFHFNRLGESENLWFRVENWPPFNCIFQFSRPRVGCDAAVLLLLSTEIISFFLVFFSSLLSVKIIKEICLIQLLLILNLWLSGLLFCERIFHVSVIRQTQFQPQVPKLQCALNALLSSFRLSGNITNHEYRTRCEMEDSKTQQKKRAQFPTCNGGDDAFLAPEKKKLKDVKRREGTIKTISWR